MSDSTHRMLVVDTTIKEGFILGAENIGPILVNGILWLLTCWIPYLNIGTTIGLTTGIVSKVSKGEMIPLTEIFDPKYRKYMGEYFLTTGLMGMGIMAGLICFIIPGYVIALSWSLALLLTVDKEKNPIEAITLSNKCTYGYKFTIVGIYIVICLLFFAAFAVLGGIAAIFITMEMNVVAAIFIILLLLALFFEIFVFIGIKASIYRQLTRDVF